MPEAGIRRKGQVEHMDDGRKKVWICLLVIVLAAVVIGILYYLSTPTVENSEGFLIRAAEVGNYVG